MEIKRRAPDAPSIVATPRPYDLQPIPQPPVAPAPAPLNFGSDRGSYLGSALSQAPWPRDGFSLPPLSSLDLPEVPHSHDAPVEGNDPPPYLDSVFRNPSRMDVDTTGLTARGHLSSNEGPGGSHMHPSAPQVPSFRPREVGERREPSLFRTSSTCIFTHDATTSNAERRWNSKDQAPTTRAWKTGEVRQHHAASYARSDLVRK